MDVVTDRITYINHSIGFYIFCNRCHFRSGIFINFFLGCFNQLVIITAVFLLRRMAGGVSVQAAGKQKALNITDLSLSVGQSQKLKVLNGKKVRWSSSKKTHKSHHRILYFLQPLSLSVWYFYQFLSWLLKIRTALIKIENLHYESQIMVDY